MPPIPSQKGTSKKGGAGAIRQRSRNTTPSSLPNSAPPPATASLPPIEAVDAEYLSLRVEQFDNIGYDDIVDQISPNSLVPESRSMDAMISRLTRLQEVIDRRTNFCDKAMRDLALQRKNHIDNAPERDDLRADEGQKRANKKKRKAADSLAPGDAVHKGTYALNRIPYLIYVPFPSPFLLFAFRVWSSIWNLDTSSFLPA